MDKVRFHDYRDQSSLERRVQELRVGLQAADPALLAAHIGAAYWPLDDGRAEIHLSLLGQPLVVTVPELLVLEAAGGDSASVNTQALILYHLQATNGAPLAGRWISFRELPSGGFYHQAFQGYTGHEIAKRFGNELPALVRTARALGGETAGVGDAAFCFQALPRVPLLLVYWLGDEDFGPTARILFDASAGHHLPTDACALLGSTLTRSLLRTVI